jgi:hypothetical protein
VNLYHPKLVISKDTKLYEACARRRATFLDRPEWRVASQTGDRHDELLDILLSIPSILELSDHLCCSSTRSCHTHSVKQQLIERHRKLQLRLLEWYRTLPDQESEDLYRVDSTVVTGLSLLENSPELAGIFSGSVIFSSEYIFELLLIYWFGSVLLYASLARVLEQLPIGTTHGNCNDRIAGENSELKEVERGGDYFATKICQTIGFCERPSVGAAGVQIVIPGLWAAQQFFEGRSPRKFHWCRMVIKGLEAKGFQSGGVIASVSHQKYADIAESLKLVEKFE